MTEILPKVYRASHHTHSSVTVNMQIESRNKAEHKPGNLNINKKVNLCKEFVY